MAEITTINVGGADYRIRDYTTSEIANSAINRANEVTNVEKQYRQDPGAFFWDRQEDDPDNKYLRAYPAGSPFIWRSYNTSTADASWYPNAMFMQTTSPVTKGTLIHPGVNCRVRTMEDLMQDISTYVSNDGKLHFKDYRGADSVLNFSGGNKKGYTSAVLRNVGDQLRFDLYNIRANSEIVFSSTNNQPCNIIIRDGNNNWLTTLHRFITGYNYVFNSDYDVVCVYLEKLSDSNTDNFWCWWQIN